MDRPVLKDAFWTLCIVPYIQVCTIKYTPWNTVDMPLEISKKKYEFSHGGYIIFTWKPLKTYIFMSNKPIKAYIFIK